MWGRAHVLVGIAAAGMLCAQNAAAVNITLNTSTTFQTVEGFGAFGSIAPWKVRQGPFYIDVDLEAVGFYDSIITELGATMIRTNIDYDFTPDYDQMHVITAGMRSKLQKLAMLKATAEVHREPVRFIASVWSPPWWMKVSKCISHGAETNPDGLACSTLNNTLDQALYLDEFAEHIGAWYAACRDTFGVEMYALSLQNEPSFNEPYASCTYYNGNNYNNMFKVVAPLVHTDHPEVKFFGVEHMGWAFPDWENSIANDATSLPHMHAWAIHGYDDGVLADTNFYNPGSPGARPLWMSETSGGSYGSGLNHWSGAMSLANSILRYLRDAKLTAWTWWSLQDIVCTTGEGCEASELGEYCLIMNGSPTAKYYSSSHFYRFIRPGAVQVASSSDDNEVQVVAFTHPANNCIAVVLRNTGGSKTVNITGSGVSSFEMHASTEAAKRVRTDVGASGISIPASSVVTLVNGTYRGTEPAVALEQPMPAVRAPLARAAARVEYYTLTGQRVAGTLQRFDGAPCLLVRDRAVGGAGTASVVVRGR